MVATRSSPRKKPLPMEEPEEVDEEVAPEDVTIEVADSEVAEKTLPPLDSNPPKLFILPKSADEDARIVTLPNPASSTPNRYFACPNTGIFEFTKVSASKSEPRSILLAPAGEKSKDDTLEETKSKKEIASTSIADGYISRSPDMFIATPVDPVFLMLPILAPAKARNQSGLFVTFDDHLESASSNLQHIMRQDRLRQQIESSSRAVCDTVNAGDEVMYRLSQDKLASYLLTKAQRMVKNGLPASLEEKFIREALQAPLMSVKREDTITSQVTTVEIDTKAGASADSPIASETPSQVETQSTTITQVSATTSMTSIAVSQHSDVDMTSAYIPSNEASPEIKHLLRLRIALEYISTCYIPSHLHTPLTTLIATKHDFTPLDAHLKHLESLHEEARALRTVSDNITRKRGHDVDDDEAAEARAEKKRKKEEEEKKKKQESNAMKSLKKVDTSGMKKLSSFFTKVPKKACS